MTTGERIRDRRKALGKSAEWLADAIGVSHSTMYRYENGSIEKCPGDVLVSIADVLHTTPAYLMGWEESAESSDAEVVRLLQEMRDDLRVLLDVQIDMTPDQVKSMMDYAKFLKGQGND